MRPSAVVPLLPAVAGGVVAGGLAALGVLVVDAVERRLTGDAPHSDVPGEAVRAPTSLHLAHGALWGALHGAVRAAGVRTLPTVAVQGAAMMVTDAAVLRAVGLTGAPWSWGGADLATSIARTGVHAVLTAGVWSVLHSPTPTGA